MQIQNNRLSVAILVGLFVLLAGCSGALGGGPSVTDTHATVVDGQPAIVFNHSVDDYSDVLLTNPDGDVINRGTLSPEKESGGLVMTDVQPGTYTVVVQQGGETVVEEELDLGGPNLRVEDVEANWKQNQLQSVDLTVRSSGELPAYVENGTISARGNDVNGSLYRWIAPGETSTVSISPTFGSIVIEESGDVQGEVLIRTSVGAISGEFTETFEGPNLEIVDYNANWEANKLQDATVTVENTGDLSTSAETMVLNGDEELASSIPKSVPVGESVQFEISGFGPIYEAQTGGEIQLSLVANSSSGFETADINHTIEGADLSIESIDPNWQNGQLKEVSFTVRNSGDASSTFETDLSVAGERINERSLSIDGKTTEEYTFIADGFSESLYTVSSGGEVTVTIAVLSGEQTLSESSSESFESADGEISSTDTMFLSQYDSNNELLSSLNFNVRNTGSVMLSYDSIRIEVDGVSRTNSPYSAIELAPGQETSEYVSFSDDVSVSPGSHDLTIQLRSDGEVVIDETVSISTGS